MKARAFRTAMGCVRISVEDEGLVEVALLDEAADRAEHPLLDEAQVQLTRYFAGELRAFDLPLAAKGTAFEQRVWSALTQIPYGVTTTYGALAKDLGTHARAVGLANGKNPIAVVVPCHRVIGGDGSLVGYAGGLQRKHWLLRHEGALLV